MGENQSEQRGKEKANGNETTGEKRMRRRRRDEPKGRNSRLSGDDSSVGDEHVDLDAATLQL